MDLKRVVPFLLLGTCLLVAVYAAVDPAGLVGQSSCCTGPTEEQPTAYGTAPGYDTVTLFTAYIYDYQLTNFNGTWVGEASPAPGDDSCYDKDPTAGFKPFTEVTSPYTEGYHWVVGQQVGWSAPARSASNTWGYDGVGYYPGAAATYYSDLSSAGKLPCGSTVYQDMAIYCRSTWTTYTENYLTSTINSPPGESEANCHEDTYGDYTACATQNF